MSAAVSLPEEYIAPKTKAPLCLFTDSIINNITMRHVNTLRHEDRHFTRQQSFMAVFEAFVRYPDAWGRNKCV